MVFAELAPSLRCLREPCTKPVPFERLPRARATAGKRRSEPGINSSFSGNLVGHAARCQLYISPSDSKDMVIRLQGANLGYWAVTAPSESESELSSQERESSNGQGAASKVVVLPSLDLHIQRGEFVLVAGPVGCGKSTLLSVIAGGSTPLDGVCELCDSRAYAAQKPFLLNGTVQENILFTQPFEAERYADALWRAALGPDLDALANGDQTLVGVEGVQLSGEQKARVALARVLCSGADLVVCERAQCCGCAHRKAPLGRGAGEWTCEKRAHSSSGDTSGAVSQTNRGVTFTCGRSSVWCCLEARLLE